MSKSSRQLARDEKVDEGVCASSECDSDLSDDYCGSDIHDTRFQKQVVEAFRDGNFRQVKKWVEQQIKLLYFMNPVLFPLLQENDGDEVDTQLLSPFGLACKNGHVDIVELFAKRVQIPRQALNVACRNGRYAVVKVLVEQAKMDVGIPPLFNINENYTPLELACLYGGNTKLVDLILRHGNYEHKHIQCSILLAAKSSVGYSIVKYFIEKKYDLNFASDTLESPIYVACKNRRTQTVKLLVERGNINIDTTVRIWQSPLTAVVEHKNYALLKYLLEDCHANVNASDICANTPLFIACMTGDVELVTFLVEHYHADIRGSFVHLVKFNFHQDIVQTIAHLFWRCIQKPIITFLCGHNLRCGENSALQLLPREVLLAIAKSAFKQRAL